MIAKRVARYLFDWLATVVALPSILLYLMQTSLVGRHRAFPGWSQMLSLLPGISGCYFRRAFYRVVLPRCASRACISFGSVLSHPTAEIGRYVYIGVGCMIGDVTLEDDVLIGSHVSIINGRGQHGIDRLDLPIREQPGVYPRITIGRDSWIGDRAVVMADVGRHCVIGAGSVVTKPVPDYAIAVGNPARVVRYRAGALINEEQLEPTGSLEPGFSTDSVPCDTVGQERT